MRKGDKSGDPSGDPQSIRCRYYDRCEIQNPFHDGTLSGRLLPERIEQMIEQELGKKETEVQYEREGSNVLFGKVREV